MRKRLIPVLLLDRNQRLVKTEVFNNRTYIGDPFNIIRIFNEKEVDEICILDIDASNDGRSPNFDFIRELASECFMPLSYGGGIGSIYDCEILNRCGVEKFILGRSAVNIPFVKQLSLIFGSQAITACVDVKLNSFREYRVVNAENLGIDLDSYCKLLQDSGIGEIIIQSVNRDGLRTGYDIPLISRLASNLKVPIVALGGAGEYSHLYDALSVGASAAASGSTFCFIGRLRAVLINYPSISKRNNSNTYKKK